MPRPIKPRWVRFDHAAAYYQPVPFPAMGTEQIELSIEELEALRLADAEGLSQEAAAAQMNVSRQTFGRIIAGARQKTADALVYGKGIHIQGGNFEFRPPEGFPGVPPTRSPQGGGPHRGRKGPHGKGPHGRGPGKGQNGKGPKGNGRR